VNPFSHPEPGDQRRIDKLLFPVTPMNANSASPGSRRLMMYDVLLPAGGFEAFQRSRLSPGGRTMVASDFSHW
jgi:hypothetical protein